MKPLHALFLIPSLIWATPEADTRDLFLARSALKSALCFAELRPELFQKGREPRILRREDKLAIWGAWSTVLESEGALDRLFHRTRKGNAQGSALANAAFLAGYRHALQWIELTNRNPDLQPILDDAVPEMGLPRGTFSRFKLRFLNVAIATEFAALQAIDRKGGSPELRAAIEEDRALIWKMGKGRGPAMTLKNALTVLKQAGFKAWFPLQKGVSGWMGDTKVHRRHEHLISPTQVENLKAVLRPGDILFERHEWYLSNLGLPGFWTHAALYVGTPEERKAWFQDPGVVAWVKAQGGADGDFEALLRTRYPQAYGRSTAPFQGAEPRVLEAISEGVTFTSLEFSGASDSLAVVRPGLPRREIAQALFRAFHYSGRPYDFNFDFQTDASLVCSELIYKAYEPGAGMGGLRFPVSEVLGRKVSTPNAMVRQFDEEPGIAEHFVVFLDGFEKERCALPVGEDTFRASWKRPNWHILVQEKRPGDSAAQ
ncbi:YiiX/YebB-like N1pC/P60 family cysteine hydrolase [Holophaga foetida]|uniref:YiiX/YebB-like N1pC/P60 family cysteine hydrolase n=1 Tax=Holophaga foetida TaxID=35839 RepID=UPI000247331D|nr:YiiX/YebB-like N1pC/P60 family cysteine hydrolase [Holophaga foetida]